MKSSWSWRLSLTHLMQIENCSLLATSLHSSAIILKQRLWRILWFTFWRICKTMICRHLFWMGWIKLLSASSHPPHNGKPWRARNLRFSPFDAPGSGAHQRQCRPALAWEREPHVPHDGTGLTDVCWRQLLPLSSIWNLCWGKQHLASYSLGTYVHVQPSCKGGVRLHHASRRSAVTGTPLCSNRPLHFFFAANSRFGKAKSLLGQNLSGRANWRCHAAAFHISVHYTAY